MTTTVSLSNTPDLLGDDYIVMGLASCFFREDGETREIDIIEPIPSASLEAIMKGITTSYKQACATTLNLVLDDNKPLLPPGFPENAQFADDYSSRVIAAARTYKRKESAQSLIPLGTTYTDFKYSTERKRILNAARVVSKEDNVKQHPNTHKVL
jgi:hypothetical protein